MNLDEILTLDRKKTPPTTVSPILAEDYYLCIHSLLSLQKISCHEPYLCGVLELDCFWNPQTASLHNSLKCTYTLKADTSRRVGTTAKIIKLIAKVYSDKILFEVRGWRIPVLTRSLLQHAMVLLVLPCTLNPKLRIAPVHGDAKFAHFFSSKILKSFLSAREKKKIKGHCQEKNTLLFSEKFFFFQ